MSAFHTAVQDYVESVVTESYRDVGNRANAVLELVEQVDERDASWALMAFGELLADPKCAYHGMTACLCEPLMRQGGDPWRIVGLVVERFRDTIRAAVTFRDEMRQRSKAAGVDAVTEIRERGEVWKALARERPWETYVAGALELYCLPMPPIVAHFPQARQLLRADPDVLDSAIMLAREVEGLDEIVLIVEENANEALVPQSDAVELALRNVSSALALGPDARQEVGAGLVELYHSLVGVELALRNFALRRLAELMIGADVGYLGDMGQLAGSLVETGADPRYALDAMMSLLPALLDAAHSFFIACLEGASPDEDAIERVKERGAAVAQRMPDEGRAFRASSPFCLGVIAMLSRSLEGRKRYCGDVALIEKARRLERAGGPAEFLCKILQVLDDETLVVIEPELQRGWKVKIHGIADNFQLHTLLAGVLVGPVNEGWIPGVVGVSRDRQPEPPNPGRPLESRAVGLARNLPCTPHDLTIYSHLQLWNWEALQADGTVPDSPLASNAHIIGNEGVPADVTSFEGNRIVLVGGCPFSRSWNCGRIFHGMHGELTIEETLDRETVSALVHQLATAPRRIG